MTRESNQIHTPYDGSSKPFTIGLKPLDGGKFIEIDAALAAYLGEKQSLAADIPDKVIVSQPESETAQEEVLNLLLRLRDRKA